MNNPNGCEITETWVNNRTVLDDTNKTVLDAPAFGSTSVCQDDAEFNTRENSCIYFDQDYLHY